MFCKKCGKELSEDTNYCPYCGQEVEKESEDIKDTVKKVTFKDGIIALFNKIFLFSGRSGQAEFNYGLLFLMLVSMFFSHLEIRQIFREDSIRPSLFKLTKVDSVFNILTGLAVAVISIS